MTFIMPESSSPPSLIYKICPALEWQSADAIYRGSADDLRDGFIHFSSARQLQGTLDKHYRDVSEVLLLEFKASDFSEDLKWEISRSGEVFPHLYGTIAKDQVERSWTLTRAGAQFDLPPDLGGAS